MKQMQSNFKAGAASLTAGRNLFKVGAVAAVLGASCMPSKAQLLYYEGFNYAAGPINGLTSTATGADAGTNKWAATGNYGIGQYPVTSPGYTYTDGTNTLATGNNRLNASSDYGYTSANYNFGTAIVGANTGTGVYNTIYASFILANSTGGQGFEIDTTIGKMKFQLSGGGVLSSFYNIAGTGGISGGGSANPTSLIVLKFDFTTAGSLTTTLYDNPNLLTPVATTSKVNTLNSSDINLTGISIGDGPGGTTKVDEIRFGDTFADVAPLAQSGGAVPEPSTWALMFGGLMSLLGYKRIIRRRLEIL